MNRLERSTTGYDINGYRVSLVLRDDDIEKIMCDTLNETMAWLREDIASLKWKLARAVHPSDYVQEDLDHHTAMLTHCAAVYNYYGGNVEGRSRE